MNLNNSSKITIFASIIVGASLIGLFSIESFIEKIAQKKPETNSSSAVKHQKPPKLEEAKDDSIRQAPPSPIPQYAPSYTPEPKKPIPSARKRPVPQNQDKGESQYHKPSTPSKHPFYQDPKDDEFAQRLQYLYKNNIPPSELTEEERNAIQEEIMRRKEIFDNMPDDEKRALQEEFRRRQQAFDNLPEEEKRKMFQNAPQQGMPSPSPYAPEPSQESDLDDSYENEIMEEYDPDYENEENYHGHNDNFIEEAYQLVNFPYGDANFH